MIVLLLLASGYVAAVGLTPLAELRPSLAAAATEAISADAAPAEELVAERSLKTAIGFAPGERVWVNDPSPHPLASLSKLITVLVCLEAQPLGAGEDGPSYTWTAADRELQDELLAIDAVAFPIPVGTELSVREMLTLILLPSANDFAIAFAHSVFGDTETFVAAVTDWAARHGLETVNFVEPSGMDERNQAGAGDLVRIARLALAHPTVSEFTGMRSAVVPAVGRVENTNPLLSSEPGIIGVKTGSLSAAGFNYIAAQETTVGDREFVKISVTLGRSSEAERADSGLAALAEMDALPQDATLAEAGTVLGSVVTWQGETVELLSDAGASTRLVPGETVTREPRLEAIGASAAGFRVGEWVLAGAGTEQRLGIVTGADIVEPDLWWRLSHPLAALGWR